MAIPQIKLGNIFKGDKIIINQSPHGKFQNYKAIDCEHPKDDKNLYAPTDGVVSTVYSSGGQRYFYFSCQLWRLQLVHAKPTVSGKVKKGQKIGELVPYKNRQGHRADHLHVAIDLNGSWAYFLTYVDQSIKLEQNKNLKWSSQKWKDWSTWGNRTLASCEKSQKPDPKDEKIAELEKKLGRCESEKKSIQDMLKSEQEATQELRNDVSKYKGQADQLQDAITTLEGDLISTKEENLKLEAKVENQAQELQKFNKYTSSIFYKLSKINFSELWKRLKR